MQGGPALKSARGAALLHPLGFYAVSASGPSEGMLLTAYPWAWFPSQRPSEGMLLTSYPCDLMLLSA